MDLVYHRTDWFYHRIARYYYTQTVITGYKSPAIEGIEKATQVSVPPLITTDIILSHYLIIYFAVIDGIVISAPITVS